MPEKEIRAQCEHRFTLIETLLSNHMVHVLGRLSRMEKILTGILTAVALEILGLLFFILKAHLRF